MPDERSCLVSGGSSRGRLAPSVFPPSFMGVACGGGVSAVVGRRGPSRGRAILLLRWGQGHGGGRVWQPGAVPPGSADGRAVSCGARFGDGGGTVRRGGDSAAMAA